MQYSFYIIITKGNIYRYSSVKVALTTHQNHRIINDISLCDQYQIIKRQYLINYTFNKYHIAPFFNLIDFFVLDNSVDVSPLAFTLEKNYNKVYKVQNSSATFLSVQLMCLENYSQPSKRLCRQGSMKTYLVLKQTRGGHK